MRKEIIFFILLLFSGTLMIYVFESIIYLDNNDFKIEKSKLLSILFWSFVKAILIVSGIIFFYFMNKKRLKEGKKPF